MGRRGGLGAHCFLKKCLAFAININMHDLAQLPVRVLGNPVGCETNFVLTRHLNELMAPTLKSVRLLERTWELRLILRS